MKPGDARIRDAEPGGKESDTEKGNTTKGETNDTACQMERREQRQALSSHAGRSRAVVGPTERGGTLSRCRYWHALRHSRNNRSAVIRPAVVAESCINQHRGCFPPSAVCPGCAENCADEQWGRNRRVPESHACGGGGRPVSFRYQGSEKKYRWGFGSRRITRISYTAVHRNTSFTEIACRLERFLLILAGSI